MQQVNRTKVSIAPNSRSILLPKREDLAGSKSAPLQKFALLSLRSFASAARQISYMVHGTSVHGT